MTKSSKSKISSFLFFLIRVFISAWVYTIVVSYSAVFAVVFALLFIPLKVLTGWDIKRTMRYFVWLYGKFWTITIRSCVKIKTINLDNLKKEKSAILIINHCSFFDTFFFGLFPIFDVNITMRAWPEKILPFRPFIKWAGYFNLEHLEYEEILKKTRAELNENAYIIFFPEGHRSRDGKLKRFHSGAFKLAIDTNTPIIPLCLKGTEILLPPNKRVLTPCKISLTALDPIYPSQFSSEEIPHIALRKFVKSQMKESLNALHV